MIAYEIATVVHDAHIDVDPALEGQRVRVIILASDAKSEMNPPPGTPQVTSEVTGPQVTSGRSGDFPEIAGLRDRVVALQTRFVSFPYDGSEIVDQRRESDR